MARITVEGCLENVANRFELVMVGSKRARQLATGGREPMVPWENDKPTVVALREIEEGFIDASILNEIPEVSFEEKTDEAGDTEMDTDSLISELQSIIASTAKSAAAKAEEDGVIIEAASKVSKLGGSSE